MEGFILNQIKCTFEDNEEIIEKCKDLIGQFRHEKIEIKLAAAERLIIENLFYFETIRSMSEPFLQAQRSSKQLNEKIDPNYIAQRVRIYSSLHEWQGLAEIFNTIKLSIE